MSTILNALKKSEELRNTKAPTQSLASNHYQYPVAEETSAPIWPYIAIAVLSTSLVCGGLFWYLSPAAIVMPVAHRAPPLPAAVNKPASIDELAAIAARDAAALKLANSAPVREVAAVVNQSVAAPAKQKAAEIEFLPEKEFKTVPLPVHVSSQRSSAPIEKIQRQSSSHGASDPLADLDLSDTSPELAAKIRLALGEQGAPAPATKSNNSDGMDYSNVSDQMAAKFQRALAADTPLPAEPKRNTAPASAIPVSNLPDDIQAKIPPFAYNSHVYSSLVEKRSVRFNGSEFKEGDTVFVPNLTLLEIRPDNVVMRYDNQSFSVNSMQDWKGY